MTSIICINFSCLEVMMKFMRKVTLMVIEISMHIIECISGHNSSY